MRTEFSLAPLGRALETWDAERRVYEAAFVIAVAKNEEVMRNAGDLVRASSDIGATAAPRVANVGPLPIAGDYHTWPDWPLWHAVGLCEQRGDGPDGIAWHGSPAGGTADSGYPGGLGMSRDYWRIFAPQAGVMVANGALASPAEQIRVGRAGSHNGTRMGGWSSWPGCIQRNGG